MKAEGLEMAANGAADILQEAIGEAGSRPPDEEVVEDGGHVQCQPGIAENELANELVADPGMEGLLEALANDGEGSQGTLQLSGKQNSRPLGNEQNEEQQPQARYRIALHSR